MTYYSGTSKLRYDLMNDLNKISPQRELDQIHCYECEEGRESDIIGVVIGFAKKRALQDHSELIVIEITRPEDFERLKYPSYPILQGRLTSKNHRVWAIDELVREKPGCSYLTGLIRS